jgi:hypothetical protein
MKAEVVEYDTEKHARVVAAVVIKLRFGSRTRKKKRSDNGIGSHITRNRSEVQEKSKSPSCKSDK